MGENYDFKEVGGRIRQLRGKSRQKDWAGKIGCDQGYISQVENGVTKPSLAFLGAVSSMTSASIDWILSGRGSKLLVTASGVSESSAPYGSGMSGPVIHDVELIDAVERIANAVPKGRAIMIALSELGDDRLRGLGQFMDVD